MSELNSDHSFLPEEFINLYNLNSEVLIGERTITLGQALEMEKAFCPAESEVKDNPDVRVYFLAKILAGAGTLLPEHMYILETKN